MHVGKAACLLAILGALATAPAAAQTRVVCESEGFGFILDVNEAARTVATTQYIFGRPNPLETVDAQFSEQTIEWRIIHRNNDRGYYQQHVLNRYSLTLTSSESWEGKLYTRQCHVSDRRKI